MAASPCAAAAPIATVCPVGDERVLVLGSVMSWRDIPRTAQRGGASPEVSAHSVSFGLIRSACEGGRLQLSVQIPESESATAENRVRCHNSFPTSTVKSQ